MITKRMLAITSLVLAIVFHFILHFGAYAVHLGGMINDGSPFLAVLSTLILMLLYIGTKWRSDLTSPFIRVVFDLLIVCIFVAYFRSMLQTSGKLEWKELVLSSFMGLSLFPVLFFIIGVNAKYFTPVNMLISGYCILTFAFSIIFMKYPELQLFLLMPIFYTIVTYPLQTNRARILTFIISAVIVVTSMTNRAGVGRIVISYMIVIAYTIALKIKFSKKLVNVAIFLVLMVPFYLLYIGVKGENVFGEALGDNAQGGYGQENMQADTRTFLYVEVFQDLKMNKAFLFGKGVNAGYLSESFQTLNRTIVEVGFLQILLKSGIVGFLLYMTMLVSAIFKAMNNSNNRFMEYLALLLLGYVLMFFIENILAFNLLNVMIWIVVGMCHSQELRELSDEEIRNLFLNVRPLEVENE
jgi:hypothetical protein